MPSLVDTVKVLILRELRAFKRELEAFGSEADIWALPPGIGNSAGTLALHCAGNLQHFIGSRLGGTGYVRDRDSEFARRNVSRIELIAEIDRAMASVDQSLDRLKDADLPAPFPDKLANKDVDASVFLVHLAVHLAYHLGQVDYHRRIVTGDSKTVDAVSVAQLPAST